MLINKTEQMKEHIGAMFDRTMSFDLLRTFVFDAQAHVVGPLLGTDLLTLLEQAGTEPLDDVHSQALQYAQRAIAWAAYQESQIGFLYQFGNAGFSKYMGKDAEKLAMWEIDIILGDTARKADETLEQLMAFLTGHKGDLPAWTQSDAYRKANALLIPTVEMLNESLPEVSATWRMLTKLQTFMPRTERTYVRGILGGALYANLKEMVSSTDEMNDTGSELWQRCRDLLAPATLWEALPSMQVRFFPDGVRVISSFKGLKDEKAAPGDQVEKLRANLWERVESTQAELKKFLNATASATVFPDYFNSSLYVAPGPAQWNLPNNEGKKHFRL